MALPKDFSLVMYVFLFGLFSKEDTWLSFTTKRLFSKGSLTIDYSIVIVEFETVLGW